MSDTATLDRVYMTLGGLKADSNSSSIDRFVYQLQLMCEYKM